MRKSEVGTQAASEDVGPCSRLVVAPSLLGVVFRAGVECPDVRRDVVGEVVRDDDARLVLEVGAASGEVGDDRDVEGIEKL